jgi:hypothetical protein
LISANDHYVVSVVCEDYDLRRSVAKLPYADLSTGSINWCELWPDKRAVPGGPVQAATYEFGLQSNSPNPFNAATKLSFTLPQHESWKVEIYDVSGRKVRTLEGEDGPGNVIVPFDGRNESRQELASGVYFWRVSTATATGIRKMAIVKKEACKGPGRTELDVSERRMEWCCRSAGHGRQGHPASTLFVNL